MKYNADVRRISLGFSCNNACVFCAQGDLRRRRPDRAPEEVSAALRRALRGADKTVAFQGGEPTLRDELPGWIARAKELGARWVVVQTNGRRLAYPDYAAALARAGLNAVDVSLHGSTPAMHDYHTRIEGSFLQTLGGLERARQAGIAAGATTVITRSNFRHLVEIVGLAHARGARAVHLELASSRGRAAEAWARVVPSPEVALPSLIDAIRAARRLKLEIQVLGALGTPGARRFFAGLGEAEPAIAAGAAVRRPAGVPRPARGAAEVRVADRKTGEALRKIFPGLFASRAEAARG